MLPIDQDASKSQEKDYTVHHSPQPAQTQEEPSTHRPATPPQTIISQTTSGQIAPFPVPIMKQPPI